MSALCRFVAVLFPVAALLLGPGPVPAQEAGRGIRLQAGLQADVLSRTVIWDGKTGFSVLSAVQGLVRAGLELPGGAVFSLLAGAGGQNWNGLVFRQLPFSVDYQAGAQGALLLGLEAEIPVLRPGSWEVGAAGRVLFAFGRSGQWTSDALNRVGTFTGRADGLAVRAGAVLAYRGFETFTPFVSAFYDDLRASFTLEENINPLFGSEEKKIRARGAVGASLGMTIEPSPSIRLRAEGFLIPGRKIEAGWKVGAGASLRAVFLF